MRALLTALALGLAACGGGKGAPAGGDAAGSTARPVGQVRNADQWVPVSAQVLHDAKMDLAVRCRLMRDEAKAKGSERPLCFDQAAKPERKVTTIALGHAANLTAAMHALTEADEGVHFVVDKSGGIYQVLDLAFVARHGGAYPEGEVRVIGCEEPGTKALIAALQALYPGAAVVEESGGKGP